MGDPTLPSGALRQLLAAAVPVLIGVVVVRASLRLTDGHVRALTDLLRFVTDVIV